MVSRSCSEPLVEPSLGKNCTAYDRPAVVDLRTFSSDTPTSG
jgi:hypothetical protein